MAFELGRKLELPKGTPRRFPPYPGATKRWSDRTRQQVHRIERKAPGVICATYAGHGRTGEPWGIDIMISPFHDRANQKQEDFGDALCNWLVRNWEEMHINYIIYWNWMRDSKRGGWFSYEPYRLKWGGGSQNIVTSRHLDHLHVQINNPHIRGNE